MERNYNTHIGIIIHYDKEKFVGTIKPEDGSPDVHFYITDADVGAGSLEGKKVKYSLSTGRDTRFASWAIVVKEI